MLADHTWRVHRTGHLTPLERRRPRPHRFAEGRALAFQLSRSHHDVHSQHTERPVLQLHGLNRPLLESVLADVVRQGLGDAALDAAAAVAALRKQRQAEARRRGLLWRLADALDRAIWTDATEYLDRDDVPQAIKLRLVQSLHQFNKAFGMYDRMLDVLLPQLDRARAQLGRTPRLLEVASGAGALALELARRVQVRGLDVELVGSDIVPAQVAHATRQAARDGLPVRFIELDASDMAGVPGGAYDVVFIAQSMHHFPPATLARFIAAATRVANCSFVGVDGHRDLLKLLLIPGPMWLLPWTAHFHDGFVSARKFHSEAELELIARIAAPGHAVKVRRAGWYSVLTAERQSLPVANSRAASASDGVADVPRQQTT